MRIYYYKDFFQLIDIIFVISIPILCLHMYKIVKEKKLLFLSTLFFIESIIESMIVYNEISTVDNFDDLYLILLILKLSMLYYLAYKINKDLFGYIVPVIFTFLLLYILIYGSINLTRIYNIGLNLAIINTACLNPIRRNYKSKDQHKNKLVANKKYIKKIVNEIDTEIRQQVYLKEDIKLTNYKLTNVLEVINTPIIMVDSKNICLMKNKYFDEFLSKNNFNKDNFDFLNFINRISMNSKEDLNEILKSSSFRESCHNIDIFNRKYKFVLIQDYINNEKITLCQINDITDICEKEAKLKQSELRYKTLMDVLSDGVIIHDGNTVNYINKIALDIFGLNSLTNNILSMDNFQHIISKISKDDFLHNIVSVSKGLKDNELSTLELENGRIINLTSCSFNMGNKKMILSIVSDITEHQIALDKLEENKKTYSTLIQTLPEGIVLINKYTKDRVYINRYMMRILNEMGVEKFYRIIDNYIEDGDYNNFRTYTINSDKKRKISMAIEQIPKQDNLLIVVRDLETEQQMETIYNSLKVIKERNKFKTEFLSRISSNLKKPITTIFEVNKFLEDKQELYNYTGVRSYIKTVRQNSYRLKRLLTNIEDISNIEAGIYDRNYKAYDLVKYLENMIDACKIYTKGKGLNIKFESNRREILIYIDKNKIEKIILNILSNALKFTEKGGEIIVSISVNEKDVIIGVEDNGSGIPSNKLDIIFENFEQVNQSLSREAEGTGVGLYLVKKLALTHHAQIKVNSKVGCGSKFEIILKDNLLESTKENRKKLEDIIIDKESIDVEFSDIYLEQ